MISQNILVLLENSKIINVSIMIGFFIYLHIKAIIKLRESKILKTQGLKISNKLNTICKILDHLIKLEGLGNFREFMWTKCFKMGDAMLGKRLTERRMVLDVSITKKEDTMMGNGRMIWLMDKVV